jgi:hypothetical protein
MSTPENLLLAAIDKTILADKICLEIVTQKITRSDGIRKLHVALQDACRAANEAEKYLAE